MTYPQCLIDELSKYGLQATGDMEWDKYILNSCRTHADDPSFFAGMHRIACKVVDEVRKSQIISNDLATESIYNAHAKFFLYVANHVVLAPQRRQFIVDDNNHDVLRFMLYYFNGCPLCEDVFPGRGYKLHKPLLLQGGVGVGKTLLMQCFSEYLRRTKNPRFFWNVSVTQMVNYYSIHNNLDLFTYHELDSKGFKCMPDNVCLNDVGIQDKTFFGMDTGLLTDEFLHARNEIWVQFGKFGHLTTNLNTQQLIDRFNAKDAYGRIVDRFKTYNVIPITGKSRR
jgi:hypothetical protein